jgi:hypothetical protein
MLVITLFQLYKKLLNMQENSNFFMKKLKYIIEHKYNPIHIITKSMISLDAFIKNHTPFYDDRYSYSDIIIIKSAHLLFNTKLKIISMILIFRVVPQLIVCTCFAYDILYDYKFNYFYKSLFILILPLFLQYIIYSITTLINLNLENLNEGLDLRILPLDIYSKDVPIEYYQIISIYEWRDLLLTRDKDDYVCYNNLSQSVLEDFKGDLLSAKASLKIAVDLMDTLFILNKFMVSYIHYKFIIETPIKIMKYTIYIIGWSYIVWLQTF